MERSSVYTYVSAHGYIGPPADDFEVLKGSGASMGSRRSNIELYWTVSEVTVTTDNDHCDSPSLHLIDPGLCLIVNVECFRRSVCLGEKRSSGRLHYRPAPQPSLPVEQPGPPRFPAVEQSKQHISVKFQIFVHGLSTELFYAMIFTDI
ncbi:hypothetical protein OSTOST_08211 [Ostertagia ostertagi]